MPLYNPDPNPLTQYFLAEGFSPEEAEDMVRGGSVRVGPSRGLRDRSIQESTERVRAFRQRLREEGIHGIPRKHPVAAAKTSPGSVPLSLDDGLDGWWEIEDAAF